MTTIFSNITSFVASSVQQVSETSMATVRFVMESPIEWVIQSATDGFSATMTSAKKQIAATLLKTAKYVDKDVQKNDLQRATEVGYARGLEIGEKIGFKKGSRVGATAVLAIEAVALLAFATIFFKPASSEFFQPLL